MKKIIAIGIQDFASLRQKDAFYIDKTDFIREWWENEDSVTLITRPQRFGKTLNMSMLNCFFSNNHAGSRHLFEGLQIWELEKYRKLQGTYPVLNLTFAGVKHVDYENTRKTLNSLIWNLFRQYEWLLKDERFSETDREIYHSISAEMDDSAAALSLNYLCEWLYRYYGKKCIVLLDEYDTPLQEAYLNHFWDELVNYIRAFFNNTFKSNPYLERAVLTGITRVSKESVFSDLNNLEVVTTTSEKYAASFGFTQQEVFCALEEQGFGTQEKANVKKWYDGFTFGNVQDIYNPWSVTAYLDKGDLDTYWANTSGNGLLSHLLRRGPLDIKQRFEELLEGKWIEVPLNEQIVFSDLDHDPETIWSLLVASGYLRVVRHQTPEEAQKGKNPLYMLELTNLETMILFEKMVSGWFAKGGGLSKFVDVMLRKDLRGMNRYMNEIALASMSYFDSGSSPSSKEPENFYHGLVLGLLVESAPDYTVESNRESGYGRYDVVLEPKDASGIAVIMEFKVFDREDGEDTLADTARNALQQIEEKKYETDLLYRGIRPENIRKYGLAFQGKTCLIQSK